MDFRECNDLAISFENLEVIEELLSPPQEAALFIHADLGKILIIDGEVQHVEAWQALYHEPLVHLSASFVDEIERVLIIGGGSLFAAHEVLKYKSVKECVLIDHDRRILEIMGKHYAHAKCVLNDDRFIHLEVDGIEYINQTEKKFDLIINDCFDLTKESTRLGNSIFFDLKKLLSDDGVCADLIYRHAFNAKNIKTTKELISNIENIVFSLVAVPEYPGILHYLMIWGNRYCQQNSSETRNRIQKQWVEMTTENLKFFNPKFRNFYLYIPPYLKSIKE